MRGDLAEVRELFEQALAAPAQEREAFLGRIPPGQRAELESLLAAHGSMGTFLAAQDEDIFVPGEEVGPYTIIERTGAGGMGLVYRARRNDGEFQREVAIKVVGGQHFAPEAHRRFIEERRILAALDHPGIVRMIDGGITRGRRYLAMEFVSGKPLNEHCAKLPLYERLRIIQRVCEAIRYAHEHLVIHRDLKAANILVTAEGQPKVLDFGIARLQESAAADSTVLHPLTLCCASPEQLREEPLTVASDVYALGLLLYEVVTGVNPQAQGTRAEIIQRIETADPQPPSRVVSGISRDLDAIVLKALAKDPARRYASAADLAADLQRLLEDRPVLARAPSRVYIAARFCSRNKVLTGVAAALIAAILGGFAAASWQARRAERERAVAQRRFDEARRMIYTVIHEIQPQLADLNGTVAVRQSLIEKTLVYLEALAQDAGDNSALIRELIDSYVALAQVAGDAGTANTGHGRRASEMLTKAQPLAGRLESIEFNEPASLRSLIALYRAMSRNASFYGMPGDAVKHAQHALRLAQRLNTVASSDPRSAMELASSWMSLGDMLSNAERIPPYQRSLAIWEEIGRKDSSQRVLRSIALVNKNIAAAWADLGDYRRSLDAAQKARVIDEALLAADPASPAAQMAVAFDLGSIGWVQFRMGDMQAAASTLGTNVAIREQVLAANPEDARAADRLAYALRDLARAEHSLGDLTSEKRDLVRVSALYENLARGGPLVPQSMFRFAMTQYDLGQIERVRGGNGCKWFFTAGRLLEDYQRRAKPDPDDMDQSKIRMAAAGCRER